MKRHRITRSAVVGLVVAAVAAPAASGQQDLRNPDTRDAAARSVQQQQGPTQDLRSPDTRDAAQGRYASNSPEVTVVRIDEPSSGGGGGGLDWGDVGIGAGGLLGLIVLASGAILAVVHRRHRPTEPPTATAV